MSYQAQRRRRIIIFWVQRIAAIVLVIGLLLAGAWWAWQSITSSPTSAIEPPVQRTATANPAGGSTPAPSGTQPTSGPTAEPPIEDSADILCPPDCADLRQSLLELVNQDRRQNGVDPLALYAPANRAAQAHAEDMLVRDFFAHESPEGSTPGDRLEQAHAGPARAWGENIWSYRAGTINGVPQPIEDWPDLVARAQNDWMNSPGHRANLLQPDFTNLGVGIVYDPDKGEVRMVQVFFTPAQ